MILTKVDYSKVSKFHQSGVNNFKVARSTCKSALHIFCCTA
uniref:Uncharacterized protein n=1 Tax=Arundo donax TaxID=35708 RepID=A0A0A9APW1_ARUDO